ncbi:DUF3040 domain-containing protein [Saccharothrix deserti]|uniref:DUF3040 domain-containing protein n=1 Tax=Saccharothrix deserti TaxID=2593674 RepID=UPI00131D7849|nr:DUF3040 domain-containing protein [Saccharothrix deserti]
MTPDEKQTLREIERRLEAEDPRLAEALRGVPCRDEPRTWPWLLLGVFGIALALLGVLTSFVLFLFGVGCAVGGFNVRHRRRRSAGGVG